MAELTVGIDAGPLLGRGGISGYVGPLVRSLLARDRQARYHLVLRRSWLAHPSAGTLDALAPVTRLRVPDRVLALCWDRLGWTLPVARALWRRLDLFLVTCLVAPVLPRGQVVSIVYDLIPLRLPALFPEHGEFLQRVERLVRRSAALVAISERTRRDLIDLLGVDPSRVHVIYPGRAAGFRPIDQSAASEVARSYAIDRPYVLYVGSFGPHKNVVSLLRAYEKARLEGGLAAKLVLAGSPRWGAETLAALETMRVRKDIVVTGEVADADLPALYSGAQLFAFPSRYEGFGLPVLEAMACGTPVIVSSGGALPEVVGTAGACLDPDDVAGMAETMCRIVREPGTRARMAAAGLARAARFSWERSADELGALLREVARSLPRVAPGRPDATFYDADYFEGRTRESPPHQREIIYPLAERTAAFLCRRLRPARALDLGCAKGFLVEALLARGARRAFGVDISTYAVSHADAIMRSRLLVADASAGLPLKSGSFDLITAVDLFEHLADPAPVLGEIRRLLGVSGTAYLKICHPRHPNARRDPSHVNVQSLGYWRRVFRGAGFTCERLYESEFVPAGNGGDRLRASVRRAREWAVVGTPADYKFLLRKRRDG